MQTYEILVRNRTILPNSEDMTLVRTSVGIDQVHILFDSAEWLEFPITATFASGDDIVTQPCLLSPVDSDEYVAETYVTIPWEVVDENGGIRVTLQGTDSQGRHIITAKGSPLSVEEAGDVDEGDAPSDAPTTDQWRQAYADAIVAVERAVSAADSMQAGLEQVLDGARDELDEAIAERLLPATDERLGSVMVGDGLYADDEGRLSVVASPGISQSERSQIMNLALLASYCFDTEFDDGVLREGATVKSSALPIATALTPGAVTPDGTSVTVDRFGFLHFVGGLVHEWDGTRLTVTSSAGSSTSDLIGPAGEIEAVTATVDSSVGTPSVEVTLGGEPTRRTINFAFSGMKGDRGERGPSGYVLTDEDIETISDEILSRYALGDTERY